MIDPHRMTDVQDIARFVTAGKAYFTLRSVKTGTRFTYRVRASKDGNVLFAGVLDGTDNESHYAYMGLIKGLHLVPTAKSKVSTDAPSSKGLSWFLEALTGGHVPSTVEFWHEGRCGCCGRRLTVPESIQNGIGPECIKRYRRG